MTSLQKARCFRFLLLAFLLAVPLLSQQPHAGGEANLVLPDLDQAVVLRRNRRTHPADGRTRCLRARPGFRPRDVQASAQSAGACVDARDLGADLRDLQNVPDHAGQVPA